MKKALQALAALVAIGGIAIWLSTGAHRGWTMTEVPNTTVDEVTGLTGGPPQKEFSANQWRYPNHIQYWSRPFEKVRCFVYRGFDCQGRRRDVFRKTK